MNNLVALHDWLLALHIIAIMFWMAGLYYLPRLFIYHAEIIEKHPMQKNNMCSVFELMEARLLRIIINPAMLAAWFFGILLLIRPGFWENAGVWIIIKLALVMFLSAYHGFLAVMRKKFYAAKNIGKPPFSSRFLRIFNEVPPLLTIFIVILVVVQPF